MKNSGARAKFLRFALVGGACFLLNLVVLYVGTDVLGWHYLFSMCISIGVVTVTGWWLNRRFTFASNDAKLIAEASRYSLGSLATMALALLMMYILVSIFHIHYLLASILLAISMTLLNFLLHSRWSFQGGSDSTRS